MIPEKVFSEIIESNLSKNKRGFAIKYPLIGIFNCICYRLKTGCQYNELKEFGKPLICAGGIGNKEQLKKALQIGYSGVQMGTRFIATKECTVHEDYKNAILKAREEDIVLTDKLSGTDCAIIKTPYIEKIGARTNWLSKKLLKNSKTKYLMRTIFALTSIRKLKKASLEGISYKDFFQAGKSVSGIDKVETVEEIMKDFSTVLNEELLSGISS
jgi:nitronate monooxygenase